MKIKAWKVIYDSQFLHSFAWIFIVGFFQFKIFAKIENECEYAFGSILSPLPSTSTVHLFAKKPVHI